jgi:SAM-dependent MidA family methyltransferase
MPVERLCWRAAGIEQLYVAAGEDGFLWCSGPLTNQNLARAARDIQQGCGPGEGYVSEINPALGPWINGIAAFLEAGLLLVSDYGEPRTGYYHPERRRGTLRCHYRHRAHDDPFLWPGLQDITARVDFTALAEAGLAAGFEVMGFATQAAFLIDCGLESLLRETGPVDSRDYLQAAGQAKQLLLPGEMGECFKFIGLGRALDVPLPGFGSQDLRGRL